MKECHSEDSQCAFVIDKIIETTSSSSDGCNFGNIAVLYRRQVESFSWSILISEYILVMLASCDLIFSYIDNWKSVPSGLPQQKNSL